VTFALPSAVGRFAAAQIMPLAILGMLCGRRKRDCDQQQPGLTPQSGERHASNGLIAASGVSAVTDGSAPFAVVEAAIGRMIERA
jgi:hypothetical protein